MREDLGSRSTATVGEAVADDVTLVVVMIAASPAGNLSPEGLVRAAHRLGTNPATTARLRLLASTLPAYFRLSEGWFSPELKPAIDTARATSLIYARNGRLNLTAAGERHHRSCVLTRRERTALAQATGRLSVPA